MTASVLLETINQDLKTAMKAGQSDVTGTLRLLVASLKNEKIAKQKDLADEEVMAVVLREVKKRKEAAAAFGAAARPELAQKEEQELAVLKKYLPEQVTEEEIKKIITQVAQENSGMPFGQVMGKVMAQLKGRADGNVVQRLVKEHLG